MGLREEDFGILRNSRYDPRAYGGLVFASFMYGGIMLLISIYAVSYADLEETVWATIKDANIVACILQLLFIVLFMISEKILYAFQRTAAVVFCLSLIKMAFEGFIIYFIICADQEFSPFMYNLGYFSMIAGVLFIIVSLIRTGYLAARGQLRSDGKGIYDFTSRRWRVVFIGIGVAFVLVSLSGMLFPFILAFANLEFMLYADDFPMSELIGLFIFNVIMFIITLLIPEGFLKTYCLFRYRSYHDPLPVRRKPKRKKQKQANHSKQAGRGD